MFTAHRDNSTNSAKDTMVNEGGPTMRDAKEKVRHFKDEARDAAHAVKEDLEGVAHRAGQQARELADSATHNVGDILDSLVSSIRKKPLKASAVLIGTGFVLGMLYRR